MIYLQSRYTHTRKDWSVPFPYWARKRKGWILFQESFPTWSSITSSTKSTPPCWRSSFALASVCLIRPSASATITAIREMMRDSTESIEQLTFAARSLHSFSVERVLGWKPRRTSYKFYRGFRFMLQDLITYVSRLATPIYRSATQTLSRYELYFLGQ